MREEKRFAAVVRVRADASAQVCSASAQRTSRWWSTWLSDTRTSFFTIWNDCVCVITACRVACAVDIIVAR
jgi:hypothetical protein